MPRRLLFLALVPPLAFPAAQDQAVPLAAGDTGEGDTSEGDTGELEFEIRARGGERLSARLTFEPEAGAPLTLFTNTTAAPRELAVRDNVLYTKSGHGRIRIPSGNYTVTASRGLEWSLASQPLALAKDGKAQLLFELEHELDTTGWVSGDFHLHTLTYSGHGDASVEERLLACLGEGLEFAVATDHNHNTDYEPTLRALGKERALATVTGNEVTTPIGHFNVFPLDPARSPPDATGSDAHALFRALRAETNPALVAPLIQVNHPRLAEMDYFTQAGLDPVHGAGSEAFTDDFDALEILNENLALGYHDPVAERVNTHGHRFSALRDWFHLLNRGARIAAVGNSDSHHVKAIVAGYPRNFVRAASDDPAHLSSAELAARVRAKELFTTTGPFVEFRVGADTRSSEVGAEARAVDGHATLALRVRAASWIDCDRAFVYVNGERVAMLPIPAGRSPVRLEQELELCFLGQCTAHGHARVAPSGRAFDAWVVVVVEGDDPLTPVLRPEARPLAITNPVWVDGDGDGRWTSPLARLTAELHAAPTPVAARAWFEHLGEEEQALALALVPRGPFAAALMEGGFESSARSVRLATARAAERHALPGATQGVLRAWKNEREDPFLGALLVRALARAQPADAARSLLGYKMRFGERALSDYESELLPLFPGGAGTPFRVRGPFPSTGELRARAPGNLAGDGQELKSDARGYLDLTGLAATTDRTLVYASTTLESPSARTVLVAFGSDDGARVWCDERLVYEDPAAKSARPLETLLALELTPGANRVVLEIENQTGAFGFYWRLLDTDVHVAASH
jgi:hypothetical protein